MGGHPTPDTRCPIQELWEGKGLPTACLLVYPERVGDYRDLRVWKKTRRLTRILYGVTDRFPHHEIFGLTSQLRRAAVSIGANLAEGFGRPTDRDTARFIGYAIGSANEVEHHLTTADDVGYLTTDESESLTETVKVIRSMLIGLQQTVLKRSSS